jgi:hypothetical protein
MNDWERIENMDNDELCEYIAKKLEYIYIQHSGFTGLSLFGVKDNKMHELPDWTSEPDVTLSLLLDTLAKSPRALQLVVYPMSTGEYSVSIEELGLIATEVVTKRLCETLNNDLTLALAQITALALTKLS